jgi:hypothetical protein
VSSNGFPDVSFTGAIEDSEVEEEETEGAVEEADELAERGVEI